MVVLKFNLIIINYEEKRNFCWEEGVVVFGLVEVEVMRVGKGNLL